MSGENILNREYVFVKELVGYFKAANAYVLTDEAGNQIGEVKEDIPGFFSKMMKFTDYKTMMPFKVHFYDENAQVYMTLWRKFSFFRSNVFLDDADGRTLGQFKQKIFTLKPKFWLLNMEGQEIGQVQGNWSGWDFKMVDAQEQPLGQVTKKWAGLGKELFTSADNYVITREPSVRDADMRKLALAAGICIDMVLKEKGR